jgi:hypothetical protein
VPVVGLFLLGVAWLLTQPFMPTTGEFKNAALNAMTAGTKPALLTEYVSVGENSGSPVSFVSISTTELEKAAHGYNTGDLIVFTALTGGGTSGGSAGIILERPYYVEKVSANVIKISQTSTISAEVFATVTASTTQKIVEIAVTARIKAKLEAAAKGVSEDNTGRTIKVPACTVNWILYFNHLTETIAKGGLHGISKVSPAETLSAPGNYEVEKSKLDLLGVA